MTTTNTITVIAAKGRRVPIHPKVATAPGGRMLVVGDDKAVDLPDVGYVRRRIRVGDLEIAGKPIAKPAPIAALAPTKES